VFRCINRLKGEDMTPEEKQKECERICGEAGKRGMHRIAPVICPIKQDEWLNTKRRPQ
jgi:hypothetical protein